ncbi:hypothetical protein PLICRDRAFT_44139, partial [Plicaturopsis crispa FD-325 SS-3]
MTAQSGRGTVCAPTHTDWMASKENEPVSNRAVRKRSPTVCDHGREAALEVHIVGIISVPPVVRRGCTLRCGAPGGGKYAGKGQGNLALRL